MESPPLALDPVPAAASAPPAPDPYPLPPAVEEEEERPWPPPMKMKRAPYAMYRVFRGMGLAGDDLLIAAYMGIHALLYVVQAVQFRSLWGAPERRFWGPLTAVVVCTCVAANALFIGLLIRSYMGVDGVKQQPAEAAAAELLPPPPPEMDMC